ncbi:MAG: type 1 glutamine amidotransferase domain-containing protein [Bacteroidota bacterium]
MTDIKGKKIAILATNGFEELELTEPKKVLEEKGATLTVIAPEKGRIKAWNSGEWSIEVEADLKIDDARAGDYDALVLPGGVINPDKLRRVPSAIDFVRSFFDDNKIVAAICHGPQLLIEAGVLKGKTMTSFHSIKTDLENAGAEWIDSEVVEDGNLITSRNPGDLEVFNKKILTRLAAE